MNCTLYNVISNPAHHEGGEEEEDRGEPRPGRVVCLVAEVGVTQTLGGAHSED